MYIQMMPPLLSHYSLEGEDRGRDEKDVKYCGDGLLGYGDDEVSVVCGRRGETSIAWLVKFAMYKGITSWTAGSP